MGSKRYHDKDWLHEKYHDEQMTMEEISDECSVTTTTISDWMDRHDVVKRGQSEAQLVDGQHTDREWLIEQYHTNERTLADMADECSVTPATVLKWMERYDIPRRDMTTHKRKEPATYRTVPRGYVQLKSKCDGETDQCWAHQLVAIADGADPHRVFSNGEYQCHHRNGVKWDNRPENIQLLSQAEHDELHAAERDRTKTGEFV